MFVGLAIGRSRLRRTLRPPGASHAIPPRVLRFEASRHARIPSPSRCVEHERPSGRWVTAPQ
jgi:hypothetical protein